MYQHATLSEAEILREDEVIVVAFDRKVEDGDAAIHFNPQRAGQRRKAAVGPENHIVDAQNKDTVNQACLKKTRIISLIRTK